jgi:hypothetical protein
MRGGAAWPRTAQAKIELAGQSKLSVLDPQAARSPPSGRDRGQQLGPEDDLRESLGVQEAGPLSSRSSTGDPVLTALSLAASRAVESSTGSAISTSPVSGIRPRTGRSATRAANHACERAGSTPQRPRGQPWLPAGPELNAGRRRGGHGHLLRLPGQPARGSRARWPARCQAGSCGADLVTSACSRYSLFIRSRCRAHLRARSGAAREGCPAGSGQLRRDRLAPSPPCSLGFPIGVEAGPWTKGQISLGEGAPVGGGGQLAEYREQAQVDALQDRL